MTGLQAIMTTKSKLQVESWKVGNLRVKLFPMPTVSQFTFRRERKEAGAKIRGHSPQYRPYEENLPNQYFGIGGQDFWGEAPKIRHLRRRFRKFWANFRKKLA